jgi:hypothetical protein
VQALNKFGMSDDPQAVAWVKEYTEIWGTEPPTKSTTGSRMPLAEALASTSALRPALPSALPPPTPTSAASADRVEDRSDTSSTGSSGAYFSSLRSSYNKLRINNPEPARPSASGSAPSLPSLKSCGLLESWTHHPQPLSQPPPDAAGMSESASSPMPPWMALRVANLPKDSAAGPSETSTSPSTSSRSTKLTMPVGLDWLAHEQ